MTTPNDELLTRLTKIETLLASLVEQRTVKEWYSTAEVATTATERRIGFTDRRVSFSAAANADFHAAAGTMASACPFGAAARAGTSG